MYNWDKGGNAPLYGVCLGIAALFFATWVAHQLEPARDQPPAVYASSPN